MREANSKTNSKIFLYSAALIFLAVLFVFIKACFAAEKFKVVINEVYATGKDNWIELYNFSNDDIDLSLANARIYKSVSSSPSLLIRIGNIADGSYSKGTIIKAHGYYLIVRDDASDDLKKIADAICTKSSFTWDGDGYTFYLSDNAVSGIGDPDTVDLLGFGKVNNFEGTVAQEIPANKSLGRLEGKDTDNNGLDFNLQNPTPGKENKKIEEKKEDDTKKEYPKGISITELFPNPFKSQYEEYIELYNGTENDVDLKGWQLHDASKTGKYIFPESLILKAKKFMAIFKKDFKFALNNSGSESVTLLDPNGESVSIVEYSGSKKNASFNFDGNRFRWSKFLTPGTENILNNEPTGTVKKDDDIFENVYANFSVSTGDTDGDKVKVVWDFGDGHKSYLAKTRHKYQKTGTYQASVKLSDGSEDVIKNFLVEVEEFPHPKIRIVGFVANPEGSDTIGERLIIENKSKKKIDLIGWSIASGLKKLVNHPIAESFVLKKKETKELTREFSKFSLNNKEGKIELRYPDGKVADKIKYNHGKDSIGEDEKYTKESGKWAWVPSQKSIKSEKVKESGEEISESSVIGNQSSDTETNTKEDTGGEVAGVEIAKKEIVMFKKNDLKNIKISEIKIVEIKTIKESNNQYFFTRQNKTPDHYAIVFLKDIFANINTKLNLALNFFFK